MYHTLLLPTLFYFVTLLVAVPVRVLFILVFLQNSSDDLFYDVAVRKRGRIKYSSPRYSPTFRLQLQELREHSRNTHCADNRPSWKMAVLAMLGVIILFIPKHP